MSISELQYVDQQGKKASVSATNVVEIRVFDDHADSVRLELLYDNGDYSLIDAQAIAPDVSDGLVQMYERNDLATIV